MKETDLMIGDWVLYENEPSVISLLDDHGFALIIPGVNAEVIVERDLQPIPITPEILEKNNISEKRAEEIYVFYNSDDFSITPDIDNKRRECWMFYCGRNEHDANICIYFVHQLQHALRLCGIEKEIVL